MDPNSDQWVLRGNKVAPVNPDQLHKIKSSFTTGAQLFPLRPESGFEH